jgi:peptide methionine sulfoxide reductase MsrA
MPFGKVFGVLRFVNNVTCLCYRGDHTETIDIDYDPKEVTYRELLDVFWKNHNPTAKTTLQVH